MVTLSVCVFLLRKPEHDRLVFTSDGRTEDDFTVTFESLDNGRRLLVIRRIAAESLDEPLVIRTVYNKISDVARWELYGEPQVATSPVASAVAQPTSPNSAPPATDSSAADLLRNALNEWISATISRDIDKQMSFYVPRLKAYYLTRNTPRAFVHREKARVFATASLIDIRAAEPEIILQDGGRSAIMRYRKKYRIENGRAEPTRGSDSGTQMAAGRTAVVDLFRARHPRTLGTPHPRILTTAKRKGLSEPRPFSSLTSSLIAMRCTLLSRFFTFIDHSF